MKRFLLIAAGTVGGLGAVLSITPPQLGASDLGLGFDMGTRATPETPAQTPIVANTNPATTAPTKSSTKPDVSNPNTSTPSKQATQTQTSAPTPAQTQAITPAAPTPIKIAPTTPTVKTVNGTFTGPIVNVSYGNVQVQITVTNGKITDAQALIAPTGKNDKYTRMALPQLKEQTLAAQSTTIQGASGASYTTYGWRKSLQGAMAKAGL